MYIIALRVALEQRGSALSGMRHMYIRLLAVRVRPNLQSFERGTSSLI